MRGMMVGGRGSPFQVPPAVGNLYQPYILAQSAIPFVGLSSGSVSAAGAITGITALPTAYANAYCYFPANKLAAAIAAGWYYCTFSSTTAGTAFLNTYTSGIPTIPASPTAVTAGQGAFTGDTGEEFGPTITIPGNAMGANGMIRIKRSFNYTNSAGTKLPVIRWSGNGGTAIESGNAQTTSVRSVVTSYIINRGVTNLQTITNEYVFAVTATAFNIINPGAIDSTANTTLVNSLTRNTATDNFILESFFIELMYGA